MFDQTPDEDQRLPFFVYGTLLPGQPNHFLWPTRIRLHEPVYFSAGVLYDMGSYPMLIEGGRGSVRGALIEVPAAHYARTLRALDRLEMYDPADPVHSVYRRVARDVTLADGTLRRAWLYIGREQWIAARKPIGGDWIAYARADRANIEAWWAWYKQTDGASLFKDENR